MVTVMGVETMVGTTSPKGVPVQLAVAVVIAVVVVGMVAVVVAIVVMLIVVDVDSWADGVGIDLIKVARKKMKRN